MRSLPALYQDDDDSNDLSDLGLSTGKKSGDGNDEMPRAGHLSEEYLQENEDVFGGAEEQVAVAVQTIAAVVKPATENGYDRAIKDYVDFAESKRTSVAKCDEQPPEAGSRKPVAAEIRRRMSAPKIEEKVMLLKTWSQSTKDLNAATSAAGELPKVDIGKRREIFEKICSETARSVGDAQQHKKNKSPNKVSAPTPPAQPTEAASVAAAVDVFRQQVVEDVSPIASPVSGKIRTLIQQRKCFMI